MGSMIEVKRPDGNTAPAYHAPASEGSGAPGVVLFEEWWGLDDRIKATADRLASQNFNVVVPDLYRGRHAATGDEANHLMQGLDFADAATQDGAGAARYLREHGAKHVGVMGFCMGGALAMLAVMHGNEFDAASLWYGYPPADAGDPAKIRVPLQGHWALHDSHFTIEGVGAIEERLKAGNVTYEFHRYDAQHGFYNAGKPGEGGLGHHHPEHAETAWRRTVEFFDRTLRS
jgi:carboxymethylenebutenolidase